MYQQTETEKLYVRRWLLMMQKQYGLYNVDNRHQCLRDIRRAQCVVRPFQYARHFYGCVTCGQYHICRLHEASCVVVVDGQRLTCQYSGQLLRQSEQLVANAYDEANDDAPLGTTNQSRGVVGAPRQCYTNMRVFGTRPTKKARVTTTSVEENDNDATTLRKIRSQVIKKNKNNNDIDLVTALGSPVEIVVETQAFVDDGGGTGGGGTGGGGDDDDEYGDYVACCGGGGVPGTDTGSSVTYHSNYTYWTQHFSYLLEDDDPRGLRPQPTETGTITNDAQKQQHIDKEMDVEYGRPLIATSTSDGLNKESTVPTHNEPCFALDIMTPATVNDIEETTASLIESLLRLQIKRVILQPGRTAPRPSARELTRLQLDLTNHFTRLIKNIAILVYNSPVLLTLYQEKQSRNQRHKQRGNNKSNAYYPASVVTPLELCLALLFNMLTKGFYHEDCCDYVVELWSPNHWLRELAYCDGSFDGNNNNTDIVSQVLGDRARTAHYKKDAALYTTERIERTVVHVKDALAHYQGHASWTRNFIMTHK